MDFMNNHLKKESYAERLKPSVFDNDENPYLQRPEKGLELCASLVSVGDKFSPAHTKLAELQQLIAERFLPLSEADYNTTGAAAYRNLQQICSDLEELIQFPDIEQHFTVAVGGMFSSGKSRFLNSMLGCELLPTDTNPTTSIPTYITQGDEDEVVALNKFQGKVVIDEDALQAICHAFHERFNVSFSHILRLVHVRRKELKYPEITFLDTPGYSKSDSIEDSGNIDEHIAREHLRRADYLIWLVDIQNGTIPADDLLFIRSLDFKRPIFFVLNKADKKTDSEIEETLNAARKDLAKACDIQAYEVIAYSSRKGKEHGDKNHLQRFLQDVSKRKSGTPLHSYAEMIFAKYIAFYESEKLRLRQQRGVLNEAALSTSLDSGLQGRSRSMAGGVKARIDDLIRAEKEMNAIKNDALKLIEEIATSNGLSLAKESIPTITHLTDLESSCEIEPMRFKGIMDNISDDMMQKLLSRPHLENLRGKVRKSDSLSVYIEVEGEFEVMATLGEIKKVIGCDNEGARSLLEAGEAVSVHLMEDKRCNIIYPAQKSE